MILDDKSKCLGRLWLHWAGMLPHDMRTPLRAIDGYERVLRSGCDKSGRPWNDDEIRRFRDGHQKNVARLDSWLDDIRVCSAGTRVTLARLIEMFAGRFAFRLIVNTEGNIEIPSPSETLGFILWILLDAASKGVFDGNKVTMDLVVTDSAGRIVIGQPDARELEQWKEIDMTESWWFVDAVEHLRASGYQVDARYKGSDCFVVMTWRRAARHTASVSVASP
jgi:hypothetical protein